VAKTLLGSLLNRTATTTPVPFASRAAAYTRGWLGGQTGATAQMRAMGSVGTLFAIVHRTSNATSQVEWKLYRKAKSGRDEDRVEVTSHAALDLWNKPNPFMPQQEFVEGTQQHVDLTGEGWWVIAQHERVKLPLEMWYVRPDRIRPVPDPETFLAGYMYTSPDGEEVALQLDEVIQLRMPNPLDPYHGMGPVQSIMPDLDSSRYAAEWNKNFFANSAEPGGIITTERNLDDNEFDQLRMRWNEQHKGVANAHRVAILEGGLTWTDRTISQRDMQFVELRGVTSDQIRQAFGISKFAIGEIDDVNRATAEAAKDWFAEYMTVPRLKRIKAALNHDLLPLFGATAKGLEFDYISPVTGNAEAEASELSTRANAAEALARGGWNPDDILPAVGLPAMRHTPPPAQAPTSRQPRSWLPAGSTLLAAVDNDAALEQVREQYTTVLEQLLADWEPIADAQIDQLAEAIETAVNDEDLTALAALTVPADDATETLAAALATMATTAAEQMASEAADQGVTVTVPTVSMKLTNRAHPAWAFGGELIEIAQATAQIITDDLARQAAVEALRHYAPGAVGRRVADSVRGTLRSLKNRFRRDQLGAAVHRAQNLGRLAVVEETPAAVYTATEKLDGATCPPCREIDGTEYTDLDTIRGLYAAGGYQQCEGGSRCRGTFTARWETP
jgi:HK97 family phage portal protein